MGKLKDRYIRFDWAIKRLLRDKANFAVLEGLLTVLFEDKTQIVEILESEGNQLAETDKFNRVDIKAKNSKGEIILVEVQNTREVYYLERILYGVAKTITEHISLGESYGNIKKVYSISIVYFDLGKGNDYLYHGQNRFIGVHTSDELQISTKQENAILSDELQISTRQENAILPKYPREIFPEYYIIRVNEFDKVAKTPLEEWVNYLKTGEIEPDTKVPGLSEAREKLKYYSMAPAERYAYDEHLNAIMIQNDVLSTAKLEGLTEGRSKGLAEGRAEGLAEGRAEGLAEGRAEGILSTARNLKAMGLSMEDISRATGLSKEDIVKL